jgi:hypothetical protein
MTVQSMQEVLEGDHDETLQGVIHGTLVYSLGPKGPDPRMFFGRCREDSDLTIS